MSKKLHHLEIHPAQNGGHAVTGHYAQESSPNGSRITYHEPEQHVFGKNEGNEMLAHLANQLKLPEPQSAENTREEEAEAS